MNLGHTLTIQAQRASGEPYRWWQGQVAQVTPDWVVVHQPIGTVVHSATGGWQNLYAIWNIFWFDHPYNLLEVYTPDGELLELYIHIASPPRLSDGQLVYVDYELDVVRAPGDEPRVVDVDEFEAAALRYEYRAELKAACWAAVDEALDLARRWKVGSVTQAGDPKDH